MKKKLLVSFLLLFFSPTKIFSADLFQNSNTACEQETVLCSSSPCSSGVVSLACKNISAIADFNGDGYGDCAAAVFSQYPPSSMNTFSIVSVLMNEGTSASACTTNPGQFNPSADHSFTGGRGKPKGNIITGNLNNDSLTDMALPILNDIVPQAFNSGTGSDGFGGNEAVINTVDVNWVIGNQATFPADTVDRSIALFDCNKDGHLDAVVTARNIDTAKINFNILINNGTGLQSATIANDTNLGGVSAVASVAVGDFDGDEYSDIAIAINDSSATSYLVTCLNKSHDCSFNPVTDCTNINLNNLSEHPGQNPAPFSVASADFNGDGFSDVAISEPGLAGNTRGVHYFLNNGNGVFTPGPHVSFDSTELTPEVVATGCFNNDNRADLAVSNSSGLTSVAGNIKTVTLNSSNTPTVTTLNFSSSEVVDANFGIDAANFHDPVGGPYKYGDDIMALGTAYEMFSVRSSYIFMNGKEDLIASVNAKSQIVRINVPVPISGTCSFNPADPNAEYAYQWSVVSPNAANATLQNANSSTVTFSATTAGQYTLRLTCRSTCYVTANSDDVIDGGSGPTVITVIDKSTEGGCFSNTLTPSDTPLNFFSFSPFLISFYFWIFKNRKNKSNLIKLFLIGAFLMSSFYSKQLFAGNSSFSTNFFQPTVDHSDYISVYSSDLMKKDLYHVGFWLDYAYHPYEFSKVPGYGRINGITDDLLTGNFLGSYAIFDWFTAGGRLPVYFWNGIHAPLLARSDENHFELGDFEIDLKFKLLDRKEYPVGWSLLAFSTLPTATHAIRDFTGNGTLSGGVKMIVDGKPHDRLSLGLNIGYQARGNVTDIGGNKIDDQFLLGAGIGIDAIKDKLKIIGETEIATVATDFFETRRTTPAEARLGFRYMFKNGIDANAGGGVGYTNGISSPDFRVFAGISYTKPKTEISPKMVEVKEEELKLADKIYFDFDKATIRSISKPTLDKAAAFIKAHLEIKSLRVEGHTCDLGTDSYNQKLSERRANSVINYLVEQGVNRSILTPVGYGESKPAVPNIDESHREENRRVQFFIQKKQ